MNMKAIIELIKHRITPLDSEKGKINITRVFHKDDYKSLDVVIDSLERGKKFEEMWKEFYNTHKGGTAYLTRRLGILMKELEQRRIKIR